MCDFFKKPGKTILAILLLSVLIGACDPEGPPERVTGEVSGYKPMYQSGMSLDLSFQEPRPLKQPGKIYVYGQWLLVNELHKGIHFIDNSQPEQPKNTGFLQALGNVDMAVRDGVLYIDHIGDLVALDFSGAPEIREISRIKGTWSTELPPEQGVWFECIDPEKGTVIGWVLTTLTNPECYR
jgi:hypothetical protein